MVVSRRCTVAVRRRVTEERHAAVGITSGSGIPAQRTELVRGQLLPVRRVVPNAANSLSGFEDQAVAATRRRDVRRRDFVDAPVRSQRVDVAKARVRHLASDSIQVGSVGPRTSASPGDSGTRQVNTCALEFVASCFEFQALNARCGKPVLVQIASGMAEVQERDLGRRRRASSDVRLGR